MAAAPLPYRRFLFGGANDNAAVQPAALDLGVSTTARVGDMIMKIKEDLGVDELMLAIEDSRKIASTRVSQYLSSYERKVYDAVTAADIAAVNKYQAVAIDGTGGNAAQLGVGDNFNQESTKRSLRNIEKLVALAWKNTYEAQMEDANAQMPLAQQIVSKYMSNFNVRPKMS
jgi:hypothetical protein